MLLSMEYISKISIFRTGLGKKNRLKREQIRND